MKTTRSRRSVCAFESLEGRALMAAYIKFDGVDGESSAQHQIAEVHIAQPPAPLLLPAVQKVRDASQRSAADAPGAGAGPHVRVFDGSGSTSQGGVRVAVGDITG